ncbi:hypothetical protein, partial [Proteus mirabilis]|uniref:hypothetical protein n=1 Tax=Proteus mirabilis TaxID=584 RepID=UPI001C88E860
TYFTVTILLAVPSHDPVGSAQSLFCGQFPVTCCRQHPVTILSSAPSHYPGSTSQSLSCRQFPVTIL